MVPEVPPNQPKKFRPPKFGGLRHLERLLGLRKDGFIPTDAIFVSLDLEVGSDRRRLHLLTERPVVNQIGFASLDTRVIRPSAASGGLRGLISVQMFVVGKQPRSKKAKKSCAFAQARQIRPTKVRSTIIRNLRVRDLSAGSTDGGLRNIVLVGHSIGGDLKILRLLGIDISSAAPILTIIDTHEISRYVLAPFRPDRRPEPGQSFSLAGVLAELGCRPPMSEFHNAGNDAVYSLYAMLLLVIKEGVARQPKRGIDELKSLAVITNVMLETLGSVVPNRVSEADQADLKPTVTLGAGLGELASRAYLGAWVH